MSVSSQLNVSSCTNTPNATHHMQRLAITNSQMLETCCRHSWRKPKKGIEPVPLQVRVCQKRGPVLQLQDPVSTVDLEVSLSQTVITKLTPTCSCTEPVRWKPGWEKLLCPPTAQYRKYAKL